MISRYPSTDYIASLMLGLKYLYRIGGPILMILGSASCLLSLIVFTRKNLRKNPCSMYFVAYNITNFLYIYWSILLLTRSIGYDIDLTIHNLISCRVTYYMGFLLDILSPFYKILASIDRILVTSSNAQTRRRSTCRLAYICIISGTLFWALFQSHALVFITIVQFSPNYTVCYFQPGLYTILIGCYSLIVKVILIPILMIIFGLWTLKHIRSVRGIKIICVLSRSGNLITTSSHSLCSKDRQLILMLLIDIIIYIVFTSMLAILAIYQQIPYRQRENIEQIQINLIVRYIATFSSNIPFCIGCCGYLLVSKTFRNEVKKILLWQ